MGHASGSEALAAGGGPGSRLARWVAGALLLALAEVTAAALPLRLQKAPEPDSNFCQTRQRTWQPSHVACSREPSSCPPLPCLPAGRLKGTRGLRGQLGHKGAPVLCQKLSGPIPRETPTAAPNPLPKSGTSLALWDAPVPSLSFLISLLGRVSLLPHHNTQKLKDFRKVVSVLK